MFYYTFNQNDTFYNRIETHPYVQFYINDSKIYYNNNKKEKVLLQLMKNTFQSDQ